MVEVVVTEALILSPLPGEDDLEKVGLEKVGLEKVGLEKVDLDQGGLGQGGAGDHGQGGAPAPQLLPPHLHDWKVFLSIRPMPGRTLCIRDKQKHRYRSAQASLRRTS